MTTEAAAYDAMFARLKACFDNGATAIAGYVPQLLWSDQAYANLTDTTHIVCRATALITDRKRTTVGRPAWFTSTGSLFVAVNSPSADRSGGTKARKLALLVQNAFEDVSELESLWYRETVVREVPTDGSWFQWRAEVRFEIHELKG
jgi:hypothetical protein